MRWPIRNMALALLLAASLTSASTALGTAAQPKTAEPKTERVIVGLDNPGDAARVRRHVAAAGGRIVESSYNGEFVVAEVGGERTQRFAERLGAVGGVEYIEKSRIVRAAFVPNDWKYPDQWHLPKVNAPQAWDITRGDRDTVIAILDTGIDPTHPDLVGNIDFENAASFVGTASPEAGDYRDYEGHGTHVAGIAAAMTDNDGLGVAGVAGGCMIMPLRVLDQNGNGSDYDLAEAIYWAVDHGADVINMSLGAYGEPAQALEDAIDYAIARDVVVVAAAGNDRSWQPFYPAACDGVLGVTATTRYDRIASFANYGSYIDISAPGVEIWSTYWDAVPLLAMLNGTSMASPIVSGAAALLASEYPEWDRERIEEALLAGVVDIGGSGKAYPSGTFGRLDIFESLRMGFADNDVPEAIASTGPVSGRVHPSADPRDVYAVALTGGRHVRVDLGGSGGGDVDVRLLAHDSTSLETATVLARTSGAGYPQSLMFEVGESGTYYLDAMAVSGNGSYRLSWRQGNPATVSLKGPATTSWGASATLTGKVQALAAAGATVKIEARPYGGSWSTFASTTSRDDGTFSAKVTPKSRTEYRAVLPDQTELLAAQSGVVVVQPKAYLTRPTAPKTAYKGRSFTSTGYLKPRHAAKGRDVKLSCYRYESKRWKLRKTVYATNANYSSYTRYSARFSLPYRGRWKIVASVKGDTTHVATSSSVRYLTVK